MVGSTAPEWLIENVLLDSFAFLEAVPDGVESVVDIGSGAGIPGIPIAIVRPERFGQPDRVPATARLVSRGRHP